MEQADRYEIWETGFSFKTFLWESKGDNTGPVKYPLLIIKVSMHLVCYIIDDRVDIDSSSVYLHDICNSDKGYWC